jgi:hypothetical protein
MCQACLNRQVEKNRGSVSLRLDASIHEERDPCICQVVKYIHMFHHFQHNMTKISLDIVLHFSDLIYFFLLKVEQNSLVILFISFMATTPADVSLINT